MACALCTFDEQRARCVVFSRARIRHGEGGSGSIWAAPWPLRICSSSWVRLVSARWPWRRASRSKVAGGSFTPVSRSITALASWTGILLTVRAAISCTEGEAPPVSLKPIAGSAG